MMMIKYIRFGKIPINEKSEIYKHDKKIGEENGVSVYYSYKIKNKYHVVLPLKITKDTISTYQMFREYSNLNVYLVTGDFVGYGNDNEPLIKNIKILKDITKDYY